MTATVHSLTSLSNLSRFDFFQSKRALRRRNLSPDLVNNLNAILPDVGKGQEREVKRGERQRERQRDRER
jgi:hypothetical protein